MPSPGDSNPSGGISIFAGCGTHCDDLEPQGPYLLGSALDALTNSGDLYYFAVNDASKGGTHFPLRVINTAALDAPSHPPLSAYDGVLVSDGTITLKLTTPTGDSDIHQFTLLRKGSTGLYDTLVCNSAIPIPGRYGIDGTRIADSSYISFACEDGDAQKCTFWGYPGTTAPDFHQACTRAARDDIWGNGHAHTHLETMIKLRDKAAIRGYPTDAALHVVPQTMPPDPANLFFEVAFSPNGAVCLGRARWHSLEPNALPDDPRTHPDARTCEDYTVDELIAKGALIFVWSHFNDTPLFRWHASTSNGLDYVTTVRGFYSTIQGQAVAPIADGLTYTFDAVDGYILRAIPESIEDPDTELALTSLYRENTTGHIVLALTADPRLDLTRYQLVPGPEGYVFTSYQDGTVLLGMFINPSTGDAFATTAANAVPPGYVPAGPIGWVLPLDHN